MFEAQLNIFDTIVIAVFGLSCLIAFFRGFIREMLSLGAWVGAGLITIYAYPTVAEWLEPKLGHQMAAIGFAAIGTYITSLIVISLFNSLLVRYAKQGADVGMIDNALGLGFGVLRGAFIVSLGYLLLSYAMDEENMPEAVQTAWTKPYAKEGAELLAKVSPSYLEGMSALKEEAMDAEETVDENADLTIPPDKRAPVRVGESDLSPNESEANALKKMLKAKPYPPKETNE